MTDTSQLKLYFRDGQIVHNFFLLFDPLVLVNDRIAQVLLEVFDGASFQISPEDPFDCKKKIVCFSLF